MSTFLGGSFESLGSTSASLIERVRQRDEEAWRRLIRLYGRLVLYWCSKSGLQRADRSDVFQEVFRAVWAHIGTFRNDREGDSFRAWLRTVTRSKILDHFRRLGREPAGGGGSDLHGQLLEQPDPIIDEDGDSSDEVEQSIVVQEALKLIRDDFEERTWQAFWRTVADGVPTSVVADELDMKPATVRKAKSRVLRRLREEIGLSLDSLEPDS